MRHLLAILLLSTSAQATEIPLKSIYATMPENGMRRATVARKAGEFTESYGPALNRIQGALRGGSSNVFLVDADSIDGAITASGRILLGYGAADVPAKAEGRTGEYWLVARLGTGPARNWIVDSATLEGSQIRVRYHKRKLEFPTLDANHYLYWVPLGKLKPGAYQLELFDGKDVSLMRRVEVQPK